MWICVCVLGASSQFHFVFFIRIPASYLKSRFSDVCRRLLEAIAKYAATESSSLLKSVSDFKTVPMQKKHFILFYFFLFYFMIKSECTHLCGFFVFFCKGTKKKTVL